MLGTVPMGLKKRLTELDIRGRIETIQMITLLKLARILRRALEISELVSQTPVKNYQQMLVGKIYKKWNDVP